MPQDNVPPVNKEAESAVIGVCLADPNAIIFVAREVSPSDFAVPVHRWIADAVWGCLDNRVPPTLAAVIDQLRAVGRWSESTSKAAVSMVDLDAALAGISESDVDYVVNNARLVRDASFRRNGFASVTRAAQLFCDTALPACEIQKSVLNTVGRVFDGRTNRDAGLSAIATEERERLERMGDDDKPGVTCGLNWLDTLTGGFMPAEAWVIAAPYKMRKTTLALNMLLSAAYANAPVSVFTVGDSSRDATYRKLLSMVMNQIMIRDRAPQDKHVVSSKTLQYRLRDTFYASVRAEAEAVLAALPIRLYDGRDLVGNLNETARILRRDAAVYGTQLFVYDFVQVTQHGLSDYERTSYFASWCQQLIGELGITAIAISQLNEETIRSNNGSYSPGAKGGGALPAMANVFLSVRYEEPLMTVELKLARDAKTSGPIVHRLNPPSGLILDANKTA